MSKFLKLMAAAFFLAATTLGASAASWNSLPSKKVSEGVAVGRNLNGLWELFIRSDSSIEHIRQPGSAWFGSLGGSIKGAPVVGRNADGRLEVFAQHKNGGAVWHTWQLSANSNNWSAWTSLGGNTTNDPIVVASNADGRLEVFVRSPGGAVWHIWQTAPNSNWSAWTPLGGNTSGPISVASNADGRLEVFVRSPSNVFHPGSAVWHIWQVAPNSNWSAWESLGGSATTDPIVVGSNADRRLEIFVRTPGSAVAHIWQVAPNSFWSGWDSLGASTKGPMAVNSNADGRLEVFMESPSGGAVWHIWQLAPNSNWSGPVALGGNVSKYIAAIRNPNGRMEVFINDAGTISYTSQTAPNNGWPP